MSIIQETVNCPTAKEFLDAISPTGFYFKEEDLYNSRWLFRGQGMDWPLKPSLFRTDPDAKKKFKALTDSDVTGNYNDLLMAEREFLVEFFRIADKRGFIIPDDSQELRSVLESMRSHKGPNVEKLPNWLVANWNVLSLVTMAQHYGIPTRLLDWTLQPFIAGFFAAEGGMRRYCEDQGDFESPDEPIVVWAFLFPKFGMKRFSYGERSDSGRLLSIQEQFSIKGVTAPGASNPNLKAQQGVFTFVHPDFSNERNNDCLPFGDILEKIASDANESGQPSRASQDVKGCKLQKFTLPVTESLELLKLLAKLDVTPSSIYPGYHSIVADMQNQGRWDR